MRDSDPAAIRPRTKFISDQIKLIPPSALQKIVNQ